MIAWPPPEPRCIVCAPVATTRRGGFYPYGRRISAATRNFPARLAAERSRRICRCGEVSPPPGRVGLEVSRQNRGGAGRIELVGARPRRGRPKGTYRAGTCSLRTSGCSAGVRRYGSVCPRPREDRLTMAAVCRTGVGTWSISTSGGGTPARRVWLPYPPRGVVTAPVLGGRPPYIAQNHHVCGCRCRIPTSRLDRCGSAALPLLRQGRCSRRRYTTRKKIDAIPLRGRVSTSSRLIRVRS